MIGAITWHEYSRGTLKQNETRAEISTGTIDCHGDPIDIFFLDVDGSAMVNNRIMILRTGRLVFQGLFPDHFELTKAANYKLQPIGIT